MKICLVSFANNQRYAKGLIRLRQSFLDKGYDGDFAFYHSEKSLGCPTHKDIPYAFKAWAMKKGVDEGYDILIWADSSMQLVAPFERVLQKILDEGHILPLNGWTSGEWCADTALEPLGITREESFTIPHIMACLMAFDCRLERNREFLRQYYERASDGITFKGAWKNTNQEVSKNPRVLGHRHDQTAASVIGYKLGMGFESHLLSYESDEKDWQDTILFINKG